MYSVKSSSMYIYTVPNTSKYLEKSIMTWHHLYSTCKKCSDHDPPPKKGTGETNWSLLAASPSASHVTEASEAVQGEASSIGSKGWKGLQREVSTEGTSGNRADTWRVGEDFRDPLDCLRYRILPWNQRLAGVWGSKLEDFEKRSQRSGSLFWYPTY